MITFNNITTVNGLLLYLSNFVDRSGKHLCESVRDKWINFGFEFERIDQNSIRLKYADFLIDVRYDTYRVTLILIKDSNLVRTVNIFHTYKLTTLTSTLRGLIGEITSYYELLKKQESESKKKSEFELKHKTENKDLEISILKQEIRELKFIIRNLNKKLAWYESKLNRDINKLKS